MPKITALDICRLFPDIPMSVANADGTLSPLHQSEAERDDERMRDPAEVADAREYNRESLGDR